MNKDIFRFWRDVEVFNLPDFKLNDDGLYLLQEGGQSLPWLVAPKHNRDNFTFKHTIFFGIVEKSLAVEQIEKYIDSNTEQDWIDPVTGHACIASLSLDSKGCPDSKSYTQASFIHGMIALRKNDSVSIITEKLEHSQQLFETRYSIAKTKELIDNQSEVPSEEKNEKGDSVTWNKIREEFSIVKALASEAGIKVAEEIYCITKEVPIGIESDAGFLNSFYFDDLNRLADGDSNLGIALSDYVGDENVKTNRIDLLKDRKTFVDLLDPNYFPKGRWPSRPDYGLYSAQQAAVNFSFRKLTENSGIIGINGPPGTGKTTLLLDIISQVIVDRAKCLMETEDLFVSGYNRIDRQAGYSGYYEINKSVFTQRGIVVASNNNAAVENITKELPSLRKIDSKTYSHAGYFRECAAELLDESCWGALAAALGNSENRSNFKKRFWNSSEKRTGFYDLLNQVYKDKDNDRSFEYASKFDRTQEQLRKLLVDLSKFTKEAAQFHSQLHPHRKNIIQKITCENDIRGIHQELRGKNEFLGLAVKDLTEIDESIERIKNMVSTHRQFRPSFFLIQMLFKSKAYTDWAAQQKTYQKELSALFTIRIDKDTVAKKLRQDVDQLNQTKNKLANELTLVEEKISSYNVQRENLKIRYGLTSENIVDVSFFEQPNEVLHILNPYSCDAINKLRSEILIKSLELHQWAVLANAKKFLNNLRLFFEMLSGKVQVSNQLAVTLWNTFFFCVPVVSTTLASVSRLFSFLGKEDIGWLLLDEAGQATPQSAAGIIWRSKRSIIVGDPLQIEPVFTVPPKLVESLRARNKVESTWSPVQSSVQTLADRITQVGTNMESAYSDDGIWAGFPLRTHRRCSDPMFSVSNKIAYSEQMVKSTKDGPFNCALGPSYWFHVTGSIKNKQIIGEEIILLKQKISELVSAGYNDKIFVISPFKSVANECKSSLRSFPSVSCGTVHTFQGKEAEIVFLVLGSDPARPKSREWASEKPNILNVAVTRAQKRFYVIGNKGLWGNCKHFDTLAIELEKLSV